MEINIKKQLLLIFTLLNSSLIIGEKTKKTDKIFKSEEFNKPLPQGYSKQHYSEKCYGCRYDGSTLACRCCSIQRKLLKSKDGCISIVGNSSQTDSYNKERGHCTWLDIPENTARLYYVRYSDGKLYAQPTKEGKKAGKTTITGQRTNQHNDEKKGTNSQCPWGTGETWE